MQDTHIVEKRAVPALISMWTECMYMYTHVQKERELAPRLSCPSFLMDFNHV